MGRYMLFGFRTFADKVYVDCVKYLQSAASGLRAFAGMGCGMGLLHPEIASFLAMTKGGLDPDVHRDGG